MILRPQYASHFTLSSRALPDKHSYPDPAEGEVQLTGGSDLPKGTQLRGRAGIA